MGLVSMVSKRKGFPQTVTLADILNIPLVLTEVHEFEGDNGRFYVMHLEDSQGNKYRAASSHQAIVPILENLEADDLPASVKFEMRGRSYFMLDVDEPIAVKQEELPLPRASREATAPKRHINRPSDSEDLPF